MSNFRRRLLMANTKPKKVYSINATYNTTGNIQVISNLFNTSRMYVDNVEVSLSSMVDYNDTSSVVRFEFDRKPNNFDGMFYRCRSLKTVDLSNMDTSDVTNLNGMLYQCTGLVSANFTNCDTRKVYDTNEMFYNCYSLTSLDLSSFDTSNVTIIYNMFFDCWTLTSLDLSNFNTSKASNMSGMFKGCTCNVICRNQEEADKYLALNSSLTVTIK